MSWEGLTLIGGWTERHLWPLISKVHSMLSSRTSIYIISEMLPKIVPHIFMNKSHSSFFFLHLLSPFTLKASLALLSPFPFPFLHHYADGGRRGHCSEFKWARCPSLPGCHVASSTQTKFIMCIKQMFFRIEHWVLHSFFPVRPGCAVSLHFYFLKIHLNQRPEILHFYCCWNSHLPRSALY